MMDANGIRREFGCTVFTSEESVTCSFPIETLRTIGGDRSDFNGKEIVEALVHESKTVSVLIESNLVAFGFHRNYKPQDWAASAKTYLIQYYESDNSSPMVLGDSIIPVETYDTSNVKLDAFRRWEIVKERALDLHRRVGVGDLEIFHPSVDMPGASATFTTKFPENRQKEFFIPEDGMEWLFDCIKECDSIEFSFNKTLSGSVKFSVSFDIEEMYN